MIKNNRTIPWLTVLLSVLTVSLSSVYKWFAADHITPTTLYPLLGAPPAIDIYDGQFWGVFWNSFLHNRIDLLLVNLSALLLLGSYIERRQGFISLFFLGLFASTCTSIVQLSLSNDAGIGLTGVNYFLFFYILARSFWDDTFRFKGRYLISILLIGVIIWCRFENSYGHWNIGVESIASGMGLGLLIGLISFIEKPVVRFGISFVIFLSFISLLFYAPWSAEWNLHVAIKLHNQNKIEQAKEYYSKALEIDPNNKNARENLYLIRIDELSNQAYYWHNQGDYLKARFYYEEILKLDPKNHWAKEQLKKLP